MRKIHSLIFRKCKWLCIWVLLAVDSFQSSDNVCRSFWKIVANSVHQLLTTNHDHKYSLQEPVASKSLHLHKSGRHDHSESSPKKLFHSVCQLYHLFNHTIWSVITITKYSIQDGDVDDQHLSTWIKELKHFFGNSCWSNQSSNLLLRNEKVIPEPESKTSLGKIISFQNLFNQTTFVTIWNPFAFGRHFSYFCCSFTLVSEWLNKSQTVPRNITQ
jgi:hypothetical protein